MKLVSPEGLSYVTQGFSPDQDEYDALFQLTRPELTLTNKTILDMNSPGALLHESIYHPDS
jgi:hypothetical protein